MYTDYIPVIVFIGLAIALLIVPLIIQHLVSPRHDKGNDKLMSYDCGEVPEGSAWVKFNIRFYIIALVFIIFDVEVVFLFPWAAVYQVFIASGNGLLVLIEMLLFVIFLTVGFAYGSTILAGTLAFLLVNAFVPFFEGNTTYQAVQATELKRNTLRDEMFGYVGVSRKLICSYFVIQ